MLWSKAWRQAATFHTNNLIESYHNQLKTIYLGRARSLRTDRLNYLLSKVVSLDYHQEQLKIFYGFQSVHLSVEEEKRRKIANELNYDAAVLFIEEVDTTLIQCRSFLYNVLFYNIEIRDGYLYKCNCPDSIRLCKHVFLVNRVTNIPYCQRSTNLSTNNIETNTVTFNETMHLNLDATNICNNFDNEIEKFQRLYANTINSKRRQFKDDPLLLDEILSKLKTSYSIMEKVGTSSQAWPSKQR